MIDDVEFHLSWLKNKKNIQANLLTLRTFYETYPYFIGPLYLGQLQWHK